MPVALIGTLAAIHIVGFSVNILTLLALVLATGLVVDDAIVVLENTVGRHAEGMGGLIVGGLGLATLSTLCLTPVADLLLARFSPSRAEESRQLARELDEALSA